MRAWLLAFAVFAGCQCGTDLQPGDGGRDAGRDAGVDAGPALFDDFPASPVLVGVDDAGVSAFKSLDAGAGGPCIGQPQPGSLFPKNFLRPRFTWSAPAGQTVFELRFTTPLERSPLIIYTSSTSWTMPAAIWQGLQAHVLDAPITFSVRGLTPGTSPKLWQGTSGSFSIAPVSAEGSIVYWTTSGGTRLKGFSMGDETVKTVLQPSQAQVQCVGCHSSTPDGLFAAFSASTSANNGDPSGIGLRSVDGNASEPSWLTAQARTLLLRQPQQAPVFSKAHWTTGDRILVSEYQPGGAFELIWTDLEASSTGQGAAWGVIARTGDEGNGAGSVVFSHDGTRLVYVSSPNLSSGVTASGQSDLRMIPWSSRAGGASVPVTGASDPGFLEYYPAFSSDDAWLAFNRVATGGGNTYNNAKAEVFVVPSNGGVATRLSANDPDQCTGGTSPGLTNSWPKWSPQATTVGAKTYHWLTFSSTRGAGGKPQLYVSPVVIEGGAVTSYPALYLWNQPADEANHTPAWDVFEISIN